MLIVNKTVEMNSCLNPAIDYILLERLSWPLWIGVSNH